MSGFQAARQPSGSKRRFPRNFHLWLDDENPEIAAASMGISSARS
jgi:hypothetical protein